MRLGLGLGRRNDDFIFNNDDDERTHDDDYLSDDRIPPFVDEPNRNQRLKPLAPASTIDGTVAVDVDNEDATIITTSDHHSKRAEIW